MISSPMLLIIFLLLVIAEDQTIRFADDSLLPIYPEFLNDDSTDTCTGFQNRNHTTNRRFTQFRIDTFVTDSDYFSVNISGSNIGCGRNLYVSTITSAQSETWAGRWTTCQFKGFSENENFDTCYYSCRSSLKLKAIQLMRMPLSSEDLFWEACHISIATRATAPFGCSNISNSRNGVYQIKLPKWDICEDVYCDQQTQGGGWTVLMRRTNGSVNFSREWEDYRNGFGSLTGDFWAGNEMMHKMTTDGKTYFLRVELESYKGEFVFAEYSNFSIGPESDKYTLHIGGYQPESTAGDSMSYHDGMMFSTAAHDNDLSSGNCCSTFGGGWWSKDCHQALLTSKYGENILFGKGIIWITAWGQYKYARYVRMMIRPA